MSKVLFFLAGLTPTTPELAEIAALQAQAVPVYDVQVRTAKVSNVHGSLEDTDYVAGTRPTAYSDTEDYPAPPQTGVVQDGQELAVVGGTVTLSVDDEGAVTAAFEADP